MSSTLMVSLRLFRLRFSMSLFAQFMVWRTLKSFGQDMP